MSGYLATGGRRDPFLPHLLEAIRHADRIDLAVAFIKSSGLALIFDALADALQYRTARLRILTSDYLDVTEPQALRRLMLLASLLDHDSFRQPLSVEELAQHARTVFQRRWRFIPDLRTDLQDLDDAKPGKWLRYWRDNPINAWTGGNRSEESHAWFEIRACRPRSFPDSCFQHDLVPDF